jgi:methylphosphotriester-DNA--protein-cysteine methyltransferase
MHLSRQAIGRWCRAHQYLRPEELLVWVRLFIVAVMLERTSRTLEAIAADMHYQSPTALRNRLREYTGMTATQIRATGLDFMLTVFSRRVEEVRAEARVVETTSKTG